MPRGAYLLVPIGIVFGIWSEWVAFGLGQPRVWLPDLLAGLTILAAGTVAWTRRPASRVGPLLALTAICWFAGNLARPLLTAAWPTAAAPAIAEALLASHRAPLVHALLGFPTGRLTTPVERFGVLVAYASVVLSIWSFGSGALIISAVAASATFVAYRQTSGRQRRAKLFAFQVAAALGVAVAGGLALRPVLGAETALLLYELAVGGSAILLAAGLARPETEDAKVADLVVELGEVRSGTLRDALAGILGDSSLEIAYRVATADAYVDASGRPVDLPEPSQRRAITRIERDGEVVAVLVHDPSVMDDPALVDAVASATRLASRNAELQAEIRGQVAELRASRRRLVGAGEAERRRLAQRLSRGAMRGLDDLFESLGSTRSAVDPSLESSERLIHARAHVERAIDELRDLARGLHPAELREGGLAPAIRGLAERSPVAVVLAISDARFPSEIEAGIYFLCAEGLANASKHASASTVEVAVRQADAVVIVELRDDGVGGADLDRGSGLRGLADRIEALGGRLTMESPTGGGTRLIAVLPLSGEA